MRINGIVIDENKTEDNYINSLEFARYNIQFKQQLERNSKMIAKVVNQADKNNLMSKYISDASKGLVELCDNTHKRLPSIMQREISMSLAIVESMEN